MHQNPKQDIDLGSERIKNVASTPCQNILKQLKRD